MDNLYTKSITKPTLLHFTGLVCVCVCVCVCALISIKLTNHNTATLAQDQCSWCSAITAAPWLLAADLAALQQAELRHLGSL